jgi:hypothetical protein
MENHQFNGKIHYKWSFSIAMLNYQRVIIPNSLRLLNMQRRELQSMDPKNMQDPWVCLRGHPGIPNLRLHHPIFIQLPLDLMVTSHLKKKTPSVNHLHRLGGELQAGFLKTVPVLFFVILRVAVKRPNCWE